MPYYLVRYILPRHQDLALRDVQFETKIKAISVPDAWLKARAEDPTRSIVAVEDEEYLGGRGFLESEFPPKRVSGGASHE